MRRTFAVSALLASALAGIATAQWPVIDVASIAKLVDQISWLRKQYSTMVDTYETVTKQYNQMVVNARMITNKNRWKVAVAPWKFPTATNTYGTTNDWINAINSGGNAANGYLQSVIRLQNYGAVWASLPASSRERISRDYGSVELADGASVNTIATLGDIRVNAPAVEGAITRLENDSLSDSTDLNTEVAVLNKINAANLIAIRNSQDTNKLLASALEHNLIESKARRDAMAQSINNDVALRTQAPVFAAQHLTGTTPVLRAYRLP